MKLRRSLLRRCTPISGRLLTSLVRITKRSIRIIPTAKIQLALLVSIHIDRPNLSRPPIHVFPHVRRLPVLQWNCENAGHQLHREWPFQRVWQRFQKAVQNFRKSFRWKYFGPISLCCFYVQRFYLEIRHFLRHIQDVGCDLWLGNVCEILLVWAISNEKTGPNGHLGKLWGHSDTFVYEALRKIGDRQGNGNGAQKALHWALHGQVLQELDQR